MRLIDADILRDEWVGAIGEYTANEILNSIDDIPTVPQEMSAREFVIAHHRMCQSKMECVECRICHDDREPRSCAVLMGLNPDDTVAVVEEWARKHPETDMTTAKYALPKIDFDERSEEDAG